MCMDVWAYNPWLGWFSFPLQLGFVLVMMDTGYIKTYFVSLSLLLPK